MKTELNLDPIKARLDAVETVYGRNWKIADDEGSDCHVLTEDSGDPFTVGEEFVPICVTSQENSDLREFLRTGLDAQRNLVAEVEKLTKQREMLRIAVEDLRKQDKHTTSLWQGAQNALNEATAENERLRNLHSSAWADVHALLAEGRDTDWTDNELTNAVMALFSRDNEKPGGPR